MSRTRNGYKFQRNVRNFFKRMINDEGEYIIIGAILVQTFKLFLEISD